jgi:hypothetical protein
VRPWRSQSLTDVPLLTSGVEEAEISTKAVAPFAHNLLIARATGSWHEACVCGGHSQTKVAIVLELAIWIGLSAVVAIGASVAGRRGTAWFIISVMISPLLAVFLLVMFSERESPEQPKRASGASGADTRRVS